MAIVSCGSSEVELRQTTDLEMIRDQMPILASGTRDQYRSMMITLLGYLMRRSRCTDLAGEGHLVLRNVLLLGRGGAIA